MIAEATQECPYLLQTGGGVRVEEPDQGLVGAFVLTLRCRLARQPTGRHGTLRREECLHRPDPSLSELIERRRIIGQHLFRGTVFGDRSSQHLMGVGTVLSSQMSCGADVEAGGVVEELLDRDDGPSGQCVFEGIELPQGHGCGPGEGNVGGLGPLLRGDLDVADTGQEPRDRCR